MEEGSKVIPFLAYRGDKDELGSDLCIVCYKAVEDMGTSTDRCRRLNILHPSLTSHLVRSPLYMSPISSPSFSQVELLFCIVLLCCFCTTSKSQVK